MEEKKRLTFAELRVGIFVIIASIILAVAIFTIGSQVGLLEETFYAKTYLNNVSGLKPGDIVLLGGVEVGNVVSVELTESNDIPPTQENQQKLLEIASLEARELTLLQDLQEAEARLQAARQSFEQTTGAPQTSPQEQRRVRHELDEAQEEVELKSREVDRFQQRLERTRQGLQNIVVYLEILGDYRNWIREDSHISLGSVGLLGDKYIEISLGRSPNPPQVVEEPVDGWLSSSDREVVLITGRTQTGFQELITGANDILANFETLSETLDDILYNFQQGEGSIGKFFADDSFYRNLNDTVLEAKSAASNASRLMNSVSEGEGTLGQLIRQRELYDRINASAERIQSIASGIEEGDGTVGRIMKDPELYDNANETMANIRDITARMDSGEGTLGRLSKDEALYEDMRKALDQLALFVDDIEKGKGTLGRLAKDEQLYENLNEVSSEVVKLIYDFRQNPRKFLTIKFEIF